MILFTFIGGFADASSFLIFGIFTGHITGNVILSIIHGVYGNIHLVIKSVIALIGFISGTLLGTWFRLRIRKKYSYSTSIALFFQFCIIIVIFILQITLHTEISDILFLLGLSFALGLQNGTIYSIKKIGIHSSYITGMATSFINTYFTLQKNDNHYIETKNNLIIQFSLLIAFVIGAFTGVLLIYVFHLMGFIVLFFLLFISIILNIYLQHKEAL
ncbi:YoaK family protein [Commensalibacter oyaizuii]|uniref:YoaK family protein n=1 Tax=Commensalibacter oyaizuii TaxID=3043873 RepID=A0ABT6Q0D9_9PROT|nr:YoaK family protein [Commensalibacter sp. TBRC 16381]MDI2090438.1 YoaK family protein [Commensalibacter sp. TBRC 16381]